MRRGLLLALLIVTPVLQAERRRAVASPAPYSIAGVDAIAAAALSDGVPGLTIAVRKGNANFVRAYGLFDREGNVPAGIDSVYQIGSVSKQFTAAAILRLVEEEKLSVDDKARKFLPELDQRFDAITIRHLLNHTSGVRDYNSQLESAYVPKTQQEIVALITSGPPMFPPGSQYEYSNSGYFLLGMILERVTARSYAQYLRDTFFEPLGLGNTSYCGTASASPDGYAFINRRTVVGVPSADMSLVFAAGALCSTAYDLVRWNASLASGIAVSPQSYARMVEESVAAYDAAGIRYGFGLMTDTFEGRRRVFHDGAILGFVSHLAWYPDEQLTVVVLMNAIDLSRDRAGEVGEAVARTVFAQSP